MYVTGTSMINSLGSSTESVIKRLYAGFNDFNHLSDIAVDYNILNMTQTVIIEALNQAKVKENYLINNKKCVVVSSTSLGDIFSNSNKSDYYIDDHISSFCFQKNIQCFNISSTCASGGDAIAHGCDLIKFHGYDLAICLGVDVFDKYRYLGHSALGTIASESCRPFSKRANGTKFSSGAACIIIESNNHFFNRMNNSAKAISQILGYSSRTDNTHLTSPDIEAKSEIDVINSTIRVSGVEKKLIGYVNAHGTGTAYNDQMESKAISSVFNNLTPLISATKAAHGHMLGASAISEAIITIYNINDKIASNIWGLTDNEEMISDLNFVLGNPKEMDSNFGMSLAFGFGGSCNAILFKSCS